MTAKLFCDPPYARLQRELIMCNFEISRISHEVYSNYNLVAAVFAFDNENYPEKLTSLRSKDRFVHISTRLNNVSRAFLLEALFMSGRPARWDHFQLRSASSGRLEFKRSWRFIHAEAQST